MKNLLSLSLLLCSLIWGGCSKDDVPAPSYDADVVIPDEVFRRFCLENYDTDGDGRLSAAEARTVREMYCHDPGIGSMEGIERFTRLEVFDCTYSYGLRGLDLSGNGNLVSVSCKDCWNLSSLNVSQCGALRKLNCDAKSRSGALVVQGQRFVDDQSEPESRAACCGSIWESSRNAEYQPELPAGGIELR